MARFSASLNMIFEDGSFENRVEKAAAAGFEGIEVIGWDRGIESISDRCESADIRLAYISGERPPLTDPNGIEAAAQSIRESIEIASRVGRPKVNVASGPRSVDHSDEAQRSAIVEVLDCVSSDAEDAGVTLVLEGINSKVDSPNQYLTTSQRASEIVREVGSPNVRLLFDFYHEQIGSGDVIRSFKRHTDVVGHVQIADNPGRHEPGTGELNYRSILSAVMESGYDGFIGCEFYPTIAPESVRTDLDSMVSQR